MGELLKVYQARRVKFYALVAVDQFPLVGITPGLSCILTASDGRDRKALQSLHCCVTVGRADLYSTRRVKVPDRATIRDPTSCSPLPVNHPIRL